MKKLNAFALKIADWKDVESHDIYFERLKKEHGLRWFAPASPTIWEVGYRDGPALVRSLKLISASDHSSEHTARPHLRRAHWHHYWIGTQDKRELILKWLPPILVNVETAEDLTPTIRPIETQ